jgi:ATP-dependent DNA ligase
LSRCSARVSELPAGETWTFEVKFDGYRCIAVKRGREVTLFSRHKKVLNRRFSSVVQALAWLGSDFVLDGKLIASDSQCLPHSNLYKAILRRIFRFIFTPSIYYAEMETFAEFVD